MQKLYQEKSQGKNVKSGVDLLKKGVPIRITSWTLKIKGLEEAASSMIFNPCSPNPSVFKMFQNSVDECV